MAREEYNLPLNEEAYNHLVSKCDGHIIKKTRYIIPIDLCNVASGRVGLYFEQSLCPWDYAAGFLLVKEAGGEFVHIDGSQVQFEERRGAVAGSKKAMDNIFKTKTGISICKDIFGV